MIRLHEGELTIGQGPAWEYGSGETTPLETGDSLALEGSGSLQSARNAIIGFTLVARRAGR